MPDLRRRRYNAETLEVTYRGKNIAVAVTATHDQVCALGRAEIPE
ncbi:hypothetical protein [Streptomyces sp900105755]|uniref:Uncharacterized protein n=1 Tax=Streptomyces sp. 900105755 TaxID=3154389 RepID=A0ABV1TA43_9ACTN